MNPKRRGGRLWIFFFLWGFLCVVVSHGVGAAPSRGDAPSTPVSSAAPTTAPHGGAAASPATSPSAHPSPPPLFKSGVGKRYLVVRIDGPLLSRHGTVVLKRSIDFARKENAALLVVEISTPGGLGTVMLGMRDALVECPIPTLAFVRKAYSAGSLLALATDRIYMHPMAHIGDAIPIQLSPTGQAGEIPPELKEKILEPMRKEFATTARYKGHPERLAIAMVDRDYDLPGLAPKGKILVLDAPTAVREGLAVKVVNTIEEAVADTGLRGAERVDFQMTTADRLASFLSTPMANVILIIIIIGGIVVEVKTPGFGLGGFIALAAVFLFFWANWYANLAHWLEILLFLAGVGLLVAEMMIPGFGIFGISGILCIVVSIFLAMFRFPPQGFSFDYSRIAPAVRNLAIALVVGLAGAVIAGGALRHTRVWKKVSLGGEMSAEKGFTGLPDLSGYVGRRGTVLTDLRPVGTVRIGGARFDAIAEGEFIGRGTEIKVAGVDGAQLVVRPLEEDDMRRR